MSPINRAGQCFVLLWVALVLGGCVAGNSGDRSPTPALEPTPTLGPTPAVTPGPPPVSGPIDPGKYHFGRGPYTPAGFTFTMPAGWVAENGGRTVSKHPDEPGAVAFGPFVIERIYSDACAPYAVQTEVGPTVDDLVGALMAQPGPDVSEPVDITLGGYPGKRVELTVPADLDVAACRIPAGLQIWLDASGGKYLLFDHDVTATVYIVDVNGERLVITTVFRFDSSEADIAEMEAILASIQIEP